MTDEQRPAPLLVGVMVVLLEALALLGYALVTLVQAVRGDRTTVLGALLLALLLVVWGAGLAFAASGLWHGRRWARSPVVVSELLLLAVGVPLIQGAGQAAGFAIVAAAVVALATVLSPPVTRVLLERD